MSESWSISVQPGFTLKLSRTLIGGEVSEVCCLLGSYTKITFLQSHKHSSPCNGFEFKTAWIVSPLWPVSWSSPACPDAFLSFPTSPEADLHHVCSSGHSLLLSQSSASSCISHGMGDALTQVRGLSWLWKPSQLLMSLEYALLVSGVLVRLRKLWCDDFSGDFILGSL